MSCLAFTTQWSTPQHMPNHTCWISEETCNCRLHKLKRDSLCNVNSFYPSVESGGKVTAIPDPPYLDMYKLRDIATYGDYYKVEILDGYSRKIRWFSKEVDYRVELGYF